MITTEQIAVQHSAPPYQGSGHIATNHNIAVSDYRSYYNGACRLLRVLSRAYVTCSVIMVMTAMVVMTWYRTIRNDVQ
jgi:hypothetical protein